MGQTAQGCSSGAELDLVELQRRLLVSRREVPMRRFWAFALACALPLALMPVGVLAGSDTHTYALHMEESNFGVAANGDRIAIDGMAEFSVHPKSVEGEGTFTHTDSNGVVRGAGTWSADNLLDYHSYGCGIVHFPDGDVILPPNFCGGAVKMSVTLTTPIGELPGIMTVICIIGPNPPNSVDAKAGEGVMLLVPGIVNFNHTDGGDNIIIQAS
jgi:hypothetical protein